MKEKEINLNTGYFQTQNDDKYVTLSSKREDKLKGMGLSS